MATTELPDSHRDLLERPLFAHLATVRPDGSPQSSVMWFDWDGSGLRLTHTKTRQRFANLTKDPRVALSIADQRPQWPDPAHPQQAHLDIVVDDLDSAEARVLDLGASRLNGGGERFRVIADPARHPFCVSL